MIKLFVLFLLLATTASARTYTNITSGNWSAAGSWTNGTVAVGGTTTIIDFNAATKTSWVSTNNNSSFTLNQLWFSASGATFKGIYGNTLTFDGVGAQIWVNAGRAFSIYAPLQLNVGTTVNVQNVSGNLLLNGNISGNGSLTIVGGGQYINIFGTNSYTGGTWLNGGAALTNAFNNNDSFGGSSGGAINWGGSGIFTPTVANLSLSNALNLDTTIKINLAAGNLTIASNVNSTTASAGITLINGNTLNLGGTGNQTINGPFSGTGNITVSGGGTLNYSGTPNSTLTGQLQTSGHNGTTGDSTINFGPTSGDNPTLTVTGIGINGQADFITYACPGQFNMSRGTLNINGNLLLTYGNWNQTGGTVNDAGTVYVSQFFGDSFTISGGSFTCATFNVTSSNTPDGTLPATAILPIKVEINPMNSNINGNNGLAEDSSDV